MLLVLAAALLAGLLVLFERREPRLGIAPVAAAIAIVIAASVATPPRTSNDAVVVQMYGRMVTVHDRSPYDHIPADFRSDPF